MLTQLLIHVSKEEGSRGEYTKELGHARGKFIDGGLSRALNEAGAWTGAAAAGETKAAHPGVLTGDWGGGPPVSGPMRPRSEH